MLSFLGLALLTATVLLPLASADFSYPPQGAVFHIGDKETIRWQTTLANYTVALWQQALAGGSATLGPIVLQMTHDGSAVDHFDWTVQTYGMDLQFSNKFFFWLLQGAATQQGNQSAPGLASSYFYITSQSSTSSSSVSSPLPTTAASPVTPQTLSTTPTAASTAAGSSEAQNGLGTGAIVGIAVSTSCIGTAAIFGVIYCIMRLRKTQKALAAQLEQQNARLDQQYDPSDRVKSPQQVTTASELPSPMDRTGNHHSLGLVELGG